MPCDLLSIDLSIFTLFHGFGDFILKEKDQNSIELKFDYVFSTFVLFNLPFKITNKIIALNESEPHQVNE